MNMHTNPRRAEIERQIEDLIEMLDQIDGGPDLEENGDEHDTGMPFAWVASSFVYDATTGYAGPILEDDEDGADTEQDTADFEPELGWLDSLNQADANRCWRNEEADLGWTGNGTGWQEGEPLEEATDEREFDPAEAGIADHDALHALEPYGPMRSSPIRMQS